MLENFFIITPILIAIIIPIILWIFLFKPFFELKGKFSFNIREKIFPDIQKASNSIITLSSAAILLTFSILQIGIVNVSSKNLIIISWFGFAACILLGILIKIVFYISRAADFIELKKIGEWRVSLKKMRTSKEKKLSHEKFKEWKSLFNKRQYFLKMLFIFIFLQPILFLTSILYTVLFAVINLL